jgi:phage/plasmid-associated DNA primase
MKKKADLQQERKDFIGAMMAGLLHQIKNTPGVPPEIRAQAAEWHENWDKHAGVRMLFNPISIVVMKRKLGL